MCGIAGTTDLQIDVPAMLARIKHRGRDATGVANVGQARVGHNRLAIRDLSSAGDQPFKVGKSVVAFNGELWNWRELRTRLPKYKWKTSCDTEVLAALLDKHGLDCLPWLDGMFAFSWSTDKETFLVRDQFGKVPLYVAKTANGIAWASERKAIKQNISKIVAIKPASYFNTRTLFAAEYYKLPNSFKENTNVIDQLRKGVRDRMDADAKVCCLLSGGIDSSLICKLATEISDDVTAYTAVYDKTSEDLKHARQIANEFNITLREIPVAVNAKVIASAIKTIEIASKAQIEIAILCLPIAKAIKQDGFKVCLSGEAADELFGGYGNFQIKVNKKPKQFVVKERKSQINKMARGNFIRCNKVFMAHGVECRLPFMETGLVEYTANLGLNESPSNKRLLKQAARGLLPVNVINRQKHTFQGGSGVAAAVKKLIRNPIKYYNAEARRIFKDLPKE